MAAPIKKKELVIDCVPIQVEDIRVPTSLVPTIKEDTFSPLNVC
jgi:hypothetical protein